ncbi:putative ankyrin [Planoprotostelium fungivorum]|uniref:Putative ankyrin n=1 Tax=Planoprotostelium fungivorum TaxID=1890364 RepID=A0A2P6NEH0_9EUKA|nr:putative ankyrin [Planoprotostelium fungivorum]
MTIILPKLTLQDNKDIQPAAEHGHHNIVQLLLTHARVDPSTNDNEAIREAASNGHIEVMRLFLADPRVDPSANDQIALKMASEKGHAMTVKLLLSDPRVEISAGAQYAIDIRPNCFTQLDSLQDATEEGGLLGLVHEMLPL